MSKDKDGWAMPPTFDDFQNEINTQRAIDRAGGGAPLEWWNEAMSLIRNLPVGTEFTTDTLWNKGLSEPPEPRALGAVVQSAKRHGLIRRVPNMWRPSTRRHSAPLRVWERTSV